MNDISSDDIFLLKQRLAEQEALIHALQEKLSNREREIDHLQAQLDKLRLLFDTCSCQTARCFNKSKGVLITGSKLKAFRNPQPSCNASQLSN
nr:hypothetical protein [Escherichia coli]